MSHRVFLCPTISNVEQWNIHEITVHVSNTGENKTQTKHCGLLWRAKISDCLSSFQQYTECNIFSVLFQIFGEKEKRWNRNRTMGLWLLWRLCTSPRQPFVVCVLWCPHPQPVPRLFWVQVGCVTPLLPLDPQIIQHTPALLIHSHTCTHFISRHKKSIILSFNALSFESSLVPLCLCRFCQLCLWNK